MPRRIMLRQIKAFKAVIEYSMPVQPPCVTIVVASEFS